MKVKFQGDLRVHLTTNLSMSKEMCRKLAALSFVGKRRRIFATCSYYKRFTGEEEFLEKVHILLEKSIYQKFMVKYLKKKGFSLSIGYPLCTDQDYIEYLQFRERNPQYASRIKPIIIRDYKTSISQTVKDKLRTEAEKKKEKTIKVTWKNGTVKYFDGTLDLCVLTDEELYFQPKRFLCDVGCHALTIDPEGNMSRCVSAADKTIFGNLCEKMPEYTTEMLRCEARRCACRYYSLIENDL